MPNGELGREPVGREKLTDPRLAGRSTPVSSCTLDNPADLWPALLGVTRLDPRPVALFGGGDATRMAGASILVARRWALDGMFFGMAGTGGASGALGTGCSGLFGDGSRNVLSVIDPELPLRCNWGRVDPATELPTEDTEADLFIVRFV